MGNGSAWLIPLPDSIAGFDQVLGTLISLEALTISKRRGTLS